jgi:methyltransferase
LPDPEERRLSLAVSVLGFVTIERLGELILARRNTKRLLAAGAAEYGAWHYPLIVALHAAWLVSLWVAALGRPVSLFWLILFAILQGLRLWVLTTLGARWTTRIIVLPGAPLVARGPYRLMRHPNYAVVVGEIAVLPLALGLPLVALVFSLANAALLTVRIQAENAALAAYDPVYSVGRNVVRRGH